MAENPGKVKCVQQFQVSGLWQAAAVNTRGLPTGKKLAYSAADRETARFYSRHHQGCMGEQRFCEAKS
jgi:hypothetical protein